MIIFHYRTYVRYARSQAGNKKNASTTVQAGISAYCLLKSSQLKSSNSTICPNALWSVFITIHFLKKKYIIYGTIIGLILFWIIVISVSRFGSGSIWQGYNSIIADLVNQGFTREQALSFIQGLPGNNGSFGFPQSLTSVVFAAQKNKNMNNISNKKGV